MGVDAGDEVDEETNTVVEAAVEEEEEVIIHMVDEVAVAEDAIMAVDMVMTTVVVPDQDQIRGGPLVNRQDK